MARALAAGVTLRLRETADAEAVIATTPDAVLLATGSTPPPLIPGMRDLDEVVRDLPTSRQDGIAVLYDRDHMIGTYDAAEALAARFRQIVILTPRDAIGRDLALVVRQRVLRRMAELRIRVVPLVEVVDYANGAVRWRNVYNGDEETLAGVTLLTHAGLRRPDQSLLAPLRAAGLAPRLIGDAAAPRDLLTAVREGHAAGLAL